MFMMIVAILLLGSAYAAERSGPTEITSRADYARGMFSPEQASETLSPFVHNANFDTDEMFRRARTRRLAEVARISLAKLGATAVDDSSLGF